LPGEIAEGMLRACAKNGEQVDVILHDSGCNHPGAVAKVAEKSVGVIDPPMDWVGVRRRRKA
jgi:hypothetical protein